MLQHTFVQVNEEGTEAAVTSVEVTADSFWPPTPPVPFVVDRPFWVALRDDLTGEVPFIGHIGDPAAR